MPQLCEALFILLIFGWVNIDLASSIGFGWQLAKIEHEQQRQSPSPLVYYCFIFNLQFDSFNWQLGSNFRWGFDQARPGQTSPGRQAVRQQLNDVASKELIMDKARGNKRRVHKAIKGKKGKTAGKCCEGVNMKNYYTSEHSSNNNGISLSKKSHLCVHQI